MMGRFLIAALAVLLVGSSIAAAPAHYTPVKGDRFAYNETILLNNGTGNYSGYTEDQDVNGSLGVTAVLPNGTESAYYFNQNFWSNSTGAQQNWNSSGTFTFSATTFFYVQGTDNQTGYTNPYVWFYMDNSLAAGDSFSLLNTQMKIVSADFSYPLETAAGKYVKAIFAEGNGSFQRDDVYGQFTATYNWKAYFDPSTGYIVGYFYTERDSNSAGDGFTYTDSLAVTQTTYPLTPDVAPPGTYAVQFVEEGLPSGTSWSITLNGTLRSSQGNTIAFTELNGSYAFSVSSVASYNSNVSSGTVKVVGQPVTLSVSFGAVPTSSGPGFPWLLVGIVFVIVAVIAVIVVVLATRSRRAGSLPRHSETGRMTYTPPPMGPPPPGIHLTPTDQPTVQQVVIKETVKVNCRYCGALIDTTVEKCPFCGAART